MIKNRFSVRTITREEINTIIEWAANEGWNPGLYDAECFYQIDSHGFFMGFLEDKPIGCISAVSYGQDFGFLGFYIVKPEYRHQGYGIQIWNEAIKYLKTQNIGLDGVVEQQNNYKKSGFKLAYNNARYQCASRRCTSKDKTIISMSPVLFDQLSAYDKQFFPADRKVFLKCWTKQPESTTLVSVLNNQVQGYGMIRKCHNGYKIGPLFANSFDVADNLFQSLTDSIKVNLPVFLDIPEINQQALKLVDKHSMRKIFSTARMYTKDFPKMPFDKIFGVTTFEVG